MNSHPTGFKERVSKASKSQTNGATEVLTPFWAWLGVGEVPSLLTLAGGGLVLSAVLGQGLSALWNSRARAA